MQASIVPAHASNASTAKYFQASANKNPFFFYGDHLHPDRSVRRIDTGLLTPRSIIGCRVHFDSSPVQPSKDTLPDCRNVFADPAAKDDTIAAAQDGKVG